MEVIRCPSCTGESLVEVTTISDTSARWICTMCGVSVRPDRPAPWLSMLLYGPVVPTPEEILLGASMEGS